MSKAELAKAMEAEDDRTEVTKLANSKGYEISSNKIINFCGLCYRISIHHALQMFFLLWGVRSVL